MFLDLEYVLLVMLPGILIGLWAQAKVKSAYNRASRIRMRRGATGAQVADAVMRSEGVTDVRIEGAPGFLSDHYHPMQKALRLSKDVYAGISLASAGIAAHEAGHAIQHARKYFPLTIRSTLVPACMAGQWIGQLAMLLGFFLLYASPAMGKTLLFWAALGYAAVFLFTLVTLPVEFNASSRAVAILGDAGILDADELPEAKRVLDAAALTYVAASVQVLLTLLYILSLLAGARD